LSHVNSDRRSEFEVNRIFDIRNKCLISAEPSELLRIYEEKKHQKVKIK
jgi:hypothetical protein